jgi:protein Mpv17
MAFFQRAWASYNKVLDVYPLYTKAATSFTGFTVGDVLAQRFVEDADKPHDYARTARMASFGLLIHGTSGHFLYKFLDTTWKGAGAQAVAKKVLFDQIVWNPLFNSAFFAWLNFTEGKSVEDYKEKLIADLPKAYTASWLVWGPLHTFNFAFIPPHQRLLYINSVQVFYNVFLSIIGNSATKEEKEKVGAEGEEEAGVLLKN